MPGYLDLGAQSIHSEVRLIFITCLASENRRQQSFESLCMRGGGWGLVEGGPTKQTHRWYGKTFFQGKLTLKWSSVGSGCKDRRGWRHIPPPPSPCPVRPCLRFWRNPTVCAVCAQTSGLLKQHNQVELSNCKCSPSGVSHYQGPHE